MSIEHENFIRLKNCLLMIREEVIEVMKDAQGSDYDAQYRLGVRRSAKAFFDSTEICDISDIINEFCHVDVDGWYSGDFNV